MTAQCPRSRSEQGWARPDAAADRAATRGRSCRAAHFDGQRFFNPTGAGGQPVWMVPRLLLASRAPWPAHVPVRPRRPPSRHDPDDVIVTFVGHATFLIQAGAGSILTDPIYSERASPVAFAGPRRVRQPAVAFDDLPDISVVVVSHNHYDHCDLPTLQALDRRFKPRFVTPLANGSLLKSVGIRRIEELDWWQDAATTAMPITLTPAQHFSARSPFDRNRALWGGFVIAAGGRRIFFAGDTGYAPHFHQVRERFGPIDLALLPIGAYEPRWFMKDVHMNPAEAVQAHVDLDARQSIGMHFGTFQLTPEAITDPVTALEAALRARQMANRRFRTLDFGESLRLESDERRRERED
jgi:L-ascorbate metabolism protein UlaG (beta-lactamase superfamily)